MKNNNKAILQKIYKKCIKTNDKGQIIWYINISIFKIYYSSYWYDSLYLISFFYLYIQYMWKKYSQTCPCGHLYYAATCIKWSPFSCPIIENFMWIEPLLGGHLFYKTNFLCPKGDLLIQVWQ